MRGIRMAAGALLTLLLLCGADGMGLGAPLRETAQMEQVRCIAVDKSGAGVEVTVAIGGGSEGTPSSQRRYGPTLPAALETLRTRPSLRQPFFAHAGHLLLGSDAAREGIGPALDAVLRSSELPVSTGMIAVEGSAGELLRGTAGKETDAEESLELLQQELVKSGEGRVFSAAEIFAAIQSRGCALTAAVRAVPTDLEGEQNAEKRIEPAGFAVLEGERLRGFVGGRTAEGLLLLLGESRGGTLSLPDGNGRAELRLGPARLRWRPCFDRAGRLTGAALRVERTATLTGLSSPAEKRPPDWARQLEEAAQREQEAAIRAAWALMASLGLDLADIEDRLTLSAPLRILRDRRTEAVPFGSRLRGLTLEPEVRITLARSLDLEPPQEGGGGRG